jgi:hypothetical protein
LAKNNSDYLFLSNHKNCFVSSLFLFSLLSTTESANPRRLHTEHTRCWTRERKKAIDAQESRPLKGTSHAPVHVPLRHIALSTTPATAKALGLNSPAPPASNEVRTLRPGVLHIAVCPALSHAPVHAHTHTHLHPPLSPALSALQISRTSAIHFFVVQITDFNEFRMRGLLVHFGARRVCVCRSPCAHVRVGRLVLSSHHHQRCCLAHPSSDLLWSPHFAKMASS